VLGGGGFDLARRTRKSFKKQVLKVPADTVDGQDVQVVDVKITIHVRDPISGVYISSSQYVLLTSDEM